MGGGEKKKIQDAEVKTVTSGLLISCCGLGQMICG